MDSSEIIGIIGIILTLLTWVIPKISLTKKIIISVVVISACLVIIRAAPKPDSSLSFPTTSSDSMGPFSSGIFHFVNGASIKIPNGFSDSNTIGTAVSYQSRSDIGGYEYAFNNADKNVEMWITLSEASISNYIDTGRYGSTGFEVLQAKHDELISEYGDPTWNDLGEDYFKLSGFKDEAIYYFYGVLSEDTFYLVDFLYPIKNRANCDRIVELTEASFKR